METQGHEEMRNGVGFMKVFLVGVLLLAASAAVCTATGWSWAKDGVLDFSDEHMRPRKAAV